MSGGNLIRRDPDAPPHPDAPADMPWWGEWCPRGKHVVLRDYMLHVRNVGPICMGCALGAGVVTLEPRP